ncbi:hypothetical protein GGF46_001716 [Coemansia sp. RSA 552]|nr:hypothetical protein GGF46_001716 [Coemansia sp. RSA 552]
MGRQGNGVSTARLPAKGRGDLGGSSSSNVGGDIPDATKGARGRGSGGSRVSASAKKTVFRPTVRAPPLGLHGRMLNSSAGESPCSKGHVEKKVGRTGLVLVNRKPIGSGASTGSSPAAPASEGQEAVMAADSSRRPDADGSAAASDGDSSAHSDNPWARRLQSHARQMAVRSTAVSPPLVMPTTTQQPSDTQNGSALAVEGRRSEASADSSSEAEAISAKDEEAEDSAVYTEEPPQYAPEPDAAVAAAAVDPGEPDIPGSESAAALPPPEQDDGRVEEPPNPDVQSLGSSGACAVSETWGGRARAAAGASLTAPTTEPPKSRWWKASLANGTRRIEKPAPAAPPKPGGKPQRPAWPKYAEEESPPARGARAQRGSRRDLAPVPTVVPPMVFTRAAIQSRERRAPTLTDPAPALTDPAPALTDLTTVASADPPVGCSVNTQDGVDQVSASSAGCEEAAADDGVADIPLRDVVSSDKTASTALAAPESQPREAAATSKPKKRTNHSGPMQAESWRSAQARSRPEAPEDPAIATGARHNSSAARGPARPQAQGERVRAATSSTAASWRANPNRASKGPPGAPVPGTELLVTAPHAPGRASDTSGAAAASVRPWYSVSAEHQSDPQGSVLDKAYHSAIAGMVDVPREGRRFPSLLHFSDASTGPAAGKHVRIAPSPPLLPPTMLADILDDGGGAAAKPTHSSGGNSVATSIAFSAGGAGSSGLAAGDVHGRARRINSVVNIGAHSSRDSTGGAKLDYQSRVRSASSLFAAGNASMASVAGPAVERINPDPSPWSQPPQPQDAPHVGNDDLWYGAGQAPAFSDARQQGSERLWGYHPLLSSQVPADAARPLYTDGAGRVLFDTTSFNPFTPGGGMLWTELGHGASDPPARTFRPQSESRPASREGNSHYDQRPPTRAPHPIGTRNPQALANGGSSGYMHSSLSHHWQPQFVSQQSQLVYGVPANGMSPYHPQMTPIPSADASACPPPAYSQQYAPDGQLEFYAVPAAGGLQEAASNGTAFFGAADLQYQTGAACPPSPMYSYAYPGGPLISTQQPQQYVQYSTPSMPHNSGPLQMMPMYMGPAGGQAGLHSASQRPMGGYSQPEVWQMHPDDNALSTSQSVQDLAKETQGLQVGADTPAGPPSSSDLASQSQTTAAAAAPHRKVHRGRRGGVKHHGRKNSKATNVAANGDSKQAPKRSSGAEKGMAPSQGSPADTLEAKQLGSSRRSRDGRRRQSSRKKPNATTVLADVA